MPNRRSHDITLSRIVIIHYIISGHTINLGRVICDTFPIYASNKGNERIGHGELITEMCIEAEVDISEGETTISLA